MTRIIISFLFLLLVVNGCKSGYELTERKSGYDSIIDKDADPEIEKIIQPYRDSISNKMEEVIGICDTLMETGQPESLLGNFICDLIIDHEYDANKMDSFPIHPVISLLNFHGLRAPLQKGDIKVKNIYEIMPFENSMVYVSMTGTEILEMAKFLVDAGGHPVSANFKLIVEKDKSFTLTINENKIDTTATYIVITTDYLSNGGDHMNFFLKNQNKTEINYKLRDLIIDQIRINTKNGNKNSAVIDGRITFR